MAEVCFSKSEVVISQPWIEIRRRHFRLLIHFNVLKAMTSRNTTPEVVLSSCGWHL